MSESNTRIQIRRGTSSDFDTANPILASGEPGFAIDTNVLKIGDGELAWAALPTINSTVEQKVAGTDTLGDGVSTSDNAYKPASNLDVVKITTLPQSFTINGVDASYNLKQFVLINDESSDTYSITISNQSSSASANNRVYCIPRTNIVLRNGQAVNFTYDSTANRWIAYKVTANNIEALSQDDYNDLVANNSVDENTIYVVTT